MALLQKLGGVVSTALAKTKKKIDDVTGKTKTDKANQNSGKAYFDAMTKAQNKKKTLL